MTITENLGALGSWSLKLSDATPAGVLAQLGYFGHLAVFRGSVDVGAVADTTLLRGARYVGVLREKSAGGQQLSGSGMLLWLGDEDHKGAVFESPLNLNALTLAQVIAAVLPPAVTVGSVTDGVGTYTGTHQWQTPRDVLDVITTAFGVEYRVNGDGTLDAGKDTSLYVSTPRCIVSTGPTVADLDLTALGGTLDADLSVIDYTSRVVLVGQKTDSATTTTFAEATADAASVPYKDVHGNTVRMTRMVSDATQTPGSAPAAAQLNLNRFARTTQVLKVDAADYEISGTFAVGDYIYLHDPATGLFDATQEVTFGGEVIHPVRIRVSGATWPVTFGHTVAFRTQGGVWIDLTRYVEFETGSTSLTVGDLPKTLGTTNANPVTTRADGSDSTVPGIPTGLTLATAPVTDAKGKQTSTITASWSAPTLNVDGSVVTDLSYFRVQYALHSTGAWAEVSTAAATIVLASLGNALNYDVRVAAVDTSGHVGGWSSVASIVTAADSTPLNAPADPTVSSYLGQLRVYWNGLDNGGAAYPLKLADVEVHVSATTGFTPSTATLVSQLSAAGAAYATAPYGSARFVKLVAVDNNGNRSASSGQVSGTTVQVADGDIAALSVGKLTAGTISVDVLVGGRLTTALTGARVEVNSTGFQKFASDGTTKLVSITGTEALLTGTYKTALTGTRIEIGAGGTTGTVSFYAPGGNAATLQATSETAGDTLAMAMPITGYGAGWNNYTVAYGPGIPQGQMTVESGAINIIVGGGGSKTANATNALVIYYLEDATAAGQATSKSHRILSGYYNRTILSGQASATGLVYAVDDATNIYGNTWGGYDGDLSLYWDGGANPNPSLRFVHAGAANNAPGGTTNVGATPAILGFNNRSPQQGIRLHGYIDATVSGRAQYAWECFDWSWTAFESFRGASFEVTSDVAVKSNVTEFEGGALAKVRSAKVKRYQRHHANPDGGGLVLGPEEIGLLAHEAPAEVLGGIASTGHQTIDLYSMSALQWAALHELADRLEAMEKGRK